MSQYHNHFEINHTITNRCELNQKNGCALFYNNFSLNKKKIARLNHDIVEHSVLPGPIQPSKGPLTIIQSGFRKNLITPMHEACSPDRCAESSCAETDSVDITHHQ